MGAHDAVAAAPVAASDADPTAPLSPIEMWRKIEQDLDSKTALPVETRDCWLYGIYKELPGGTRFEIECGTARAVGRCRQASETQKARTRARPAPGSGDDPPRPTWFRRACRPNRNAWLTS